MEFKISAAVAEKLEKKHQVSRAEIAECFANRIGPYFTDTRLEHQTNPPTYWFVAKTDKGRTLKVVFVQEPQFFAIKSAFTPTDGSDSLYETLCKRKRHAARPPEKES